MIIRPSFTVLSGAAIGLVAGAAVFGAVSSAATPTAKTAEPVVAAAPAAVAHCAPGQKLEDGVCVIHVVRTVVVPAPPAAQAPTNAGSPGAALDASKSATIDEAPNAADPATKAGEGADSETEDAAGATEGSALDDSADQAANDDSSLSAH